MMLIMMVFVLSSMVMVMIVVVVQKMGFYDQNKAQKNQNASSANLYPEHIAHPRSKSESGG